jgi:hypothetical protein
MAVERALQANHCLTPRAVLRAEGRGDNEAMTIFYWVMSVLIVGTFVPSVLYLVLYAATGEPSCMSRARTLWNFSRVLTLLAFNLLIWGHVAVGLWHIWFR